MLLLILDTETTGTDAKVDHLLEVAMCEYDTTIGAIIHVRSMLVCRDTGNDTNAAEHVNGISPALLRYGYELEKVFDQVALDARYVDAIVAHNADFDRQWFTGAVRVDKRWVCSCNDIEWPKGGTGSKSLPSLALAHGVPVAHAHRAFDDVLTLARMFQRVAETGTDVDAMMAKAMRPKKRFVSLAPFAMKDEVKAAGFRWDSDARVWWRDMPPEDAAALSFKTVAQD